MDVSHECNLLVQEIQRLGSKNADGKTMVKFGVLFNDDRCANIFEALVGTLKAAKKKKLINFQGELLLQGVHDNVDIILLQEWGGCSDRRPSSSCVSYWILLNTELLQYTGLSLSFCFHLFPFIYTAQCFNGNTVTNQIRPYLWTQLACVHMILFDFSVPDLIIFYGFQGWAVNSHSFRLHGKWCFFLRHCHFINHRCHFAILLGLQMHKSGM